MVDHSDIDLDNLRTADVYLLGRALVARQERTDLAEAGIDYNLVKHNPVGRPIDWVNPNMDVTNSEAWIAVDDPTPAVLTIPPIEHRYYTVQIIDEWGEVITNINPRTYPTHPHGTYAFVSPGSATQIPAGAARIELRSGKAKLLARIELAQDPGPAVLLQHAMVISLPVYVLLDRPWPRRSCAMVRSLRRRASRAPPARRPSTAASRG